MKKITFIFLTGLFLSLCCSNHFLYESSGSHEQNKLARQARRYWLLSKQDDISSQERNHYKVLSAQCWREWANNSGNVNKASELLKEG